MKELTTFQREEKARLEAMGFIVGERDPNMNTAFTGAFMVAEPYEPGYTQPDAMGGDGVWCIVGDDLGHLIEDAGSFWEPTE